MCPLFHARWSADWPGLPYRQTVASVRGLAAALRSAIALGALLGGASPASAAVAEARSLVLSVDRDGKQEAAWGAAVTVHLGHSGESPVAAPRLSAKDRECQGPQCLDAIAAREHARYILTLSVQTNAPGSFVLTGTLYDSVQHLPYPLPRPAVCDCSPAELIGRLGEAADELFKEYRRRSSTGNTESGSAPAPSAGPGRAAPEPSLGPGNPPGPAPAHVAASLSARRKLIAGVLGGIGIGTLATAVSLTLLDGSVAPPPCESSRAMPQCLWDTRTSSGILYGTTAALAVSVAITLFLPERSAKEKGLPRPAAASAASRVEY